ncbi:HNH endonuclease [Paraburkholderia terricola]|uniref:HNH endonuclease n=1 Tax=Paraburkholderia terricola TaxID=169427 RepID=UPI001FC9E899|nr:HNH endonuclease [Paraburkholderia terricola]
MNIQMAQKITHDQIAAAFNVASDVFDQKLSKVRGVQTLYENHGVNEVSAGDLIEIFRSMMAGKVFQRTLSIDGTRYFLQRIEEERPTHLAGAVASNVKHLDYYERLPTGHPQPSKRKLVNEWVARLSEPRDLNALEAAFWQSVDSALTDSPDIRQGRLQHSKKLPEKIKVVTEAYVRNPDVVAEALHRARGQCGRCKQPAPFSRRQDGSPYLEVHHIQLLKDGGEDTVENAIALCPNCHRELHFGAAGRLLSSE